MNDAKVEVYKLRRDADLAVATYKQLGFPNILVLGPLDLIEGAAMGSSGWLVLATHANVMTAGQ